MTQEDLFELGFILYGVQEDYPYYRIVFRDPYKFGITFLSGTLDKDIFLLYANNVQYTDKNELKKVFDVVGS